MFSSVLFICTSINSHLSFLDQNLDLGSLLTGVANALGEDSEEEEDLSHLPPEIKQLREKERRSANNAREVRLSANNAREASKPRRLY